MKIRQRHTLTPEEIEVGGRLYENGSLLREIAERCDVRAEQLRTACSAMASGCDLVVVVVLKQQYHQICEEPQPCTG